MPQPKSRPSTASPTEARAELLRWALWNLAQQGEAPAWLRSYCDAVLALEREVYGDE